MVFSFLTEDNIYDRYKDAKAYTDLLTEPFPEFERIARNRPHENIDPAYPKTTDGTTASIIRKTPRRIIQQLPTGKVETETDDWISVIAEFIYTHKILPCANDEYDLIQKSWTVVEKGLSFGSCPTYTPFLNHDGYLSPDVTVPYWGDIFLQRGKKSGYACNYIFLRSWWQKEDLEALIKQQSELSEETERTWDVECLKKILDAATTKDEKAKTPAENERGAEVKGIELVTGFQKGVGATFFTFHPGEKEIVRRKKNKDPRGKMPIDWMYGDIDGSNPLGRGIIELVGGLQNLIDADMQMYQYNRALMLAPPVVKKGNFSKNKVRFVPHAVIDLGTDERASVEPLKIDTSAVINYPNLYGLQKSQLLNLVASPDTSISGDVGNPGFSKTPAGINQQKANISVDDNYVRKMFEAWFENWSETAINLYFAERAGKEELQLDKDTANKLRKLAEEGKFDLANLSDDNRILVDYDSATPALKFRVDASTSKMKDDSDQLTALTGLLQTLEQNPILMQIVPQEKIAGAWNSIVSASGVEDPENLSIDLEEMKKQQELAQAQQEAQMQAQQTQVQTPLPEETPTSQNLTPEDEQIIAALQELGASDTQIQQALAMADQGIPADDILTAVVG